MSTGAVGARRQRSRLGPRARDEPVGRVRLRAARLDLRPDPRALLPAARRSARPRSRPCACCSPRRRRDARARPCAWTRDRRHGHAGARSIPARSSSARTLDARRRIRPCRRRSPSRSPAPLSVNGTPYRGKLVVSFDGKLVSGDRRRRARAVPEGRRSGGDAVELARRRARGAGGRRPLVRAREPRQGRAVRPLRRLAQPGVRRCRRRVAGDERRRRRDRRAVVLCYDGNVADTLFFSSSGGRTVSALEATGRRRAVPRLGAPIRTTRCRRTTTGARCCSTRAKAAEGAEARRRRSPTLQSPIGPSGRVQSVSARLVATTPQVTFTGQPGARRARPALDLVHARAARAAVERPHHDLRRCGVARRGGATAQTRCDARGEAGGRARLGRRRRARRSASDGSFSLSVKPRLATPYRLAWGSARVGLAKVAVAAARRRRPSSTVRRQRDDRAGARRRAACSSSEQSGTALDDRLVDRHRRRRRVRSFGGSAGRRHLSRPGAPGHGLAAGALRAAAVP